MTNSFYVKIYKLHKEDIYLLNGTIGAWTTAIYLCIDYGLSLFLKTVPIPLYSSRLVLSRSIGWDMFYGVMADVIAGTFLGAITTFVLESSNYKNLIQKGVIAGGILWIMHVSIIPKLWDPSVTEFLTRATIYQSFYTHAFWGVLFGYIVQRFVQEINKSDSVVHKIVKV